MTDLLLLKYLEKSTDYKICPAVDTVFSNPEDKHHHNFLPLLSVDLNLIKENWSGQVHFIYYEAKDQPTVRFQVEGNKYRYHHDFNFDNDELADYERNEGFVQYVEVSLPNDSTTWGDAIRAEIDKIEEDEDGFMDYFSAAHLRGKPIWKKEAAAPLNQAGKPMHFIGQVVADAFSDDTEDFWLYLFYCPKENLAVQVTQ